MSQQLIYEDILLEDLRNRRGTNESSSCELPAMVLFVGQLFDSSEEETGEKVARLVACDVEGIFVDFLAVEDEQSLLNFIKAGTGDDNSTLLPIHVKEHELHLELVDCSHVLRIGHFIRTFASQQLHLNLTSPAISSLRHIENYSEKYATVLGRVRKALISQEGGGLSKKFRDNIIASIKDVSRKKPIVFLHPTDRLQLLQQVASDASFSNASHTSLCGRDQRYYPVAASMKKFNFQGAKLTNDQRNVATFQSNKLLIPRKTEKDARQQKQSEQPRHDCIDEEWNEMLQQQSLQQQQQQSQTAVDTSYFARLQKNKQDRILKKRLAIYDEAREGGKSAKRGGSTNANKNSRRLSRRKQREDARVIPVDEQTHPTKRRFLNREYFIVSDLEEESCTEEEGEEEEGDNQLQQLHPPRPAKQQRLQTTIRLRKFQLRQSANESALLRLRRNKKIKQEEAYQQPSEFIVKQKEEKEEEEETESNIKEEQPATTRSEPHG